MDRKKRNLNIPIRSDHTPATSGMLYEMEGRLTNKLESSMHSLRVEFRGEFQKVNSDMSDIKSNVQDIQSEIGGMKSEMGSVKLEMSSMKSEIKATFHDIKSELHRVALLVEEQNSRNKFVMDGYAQIYEWVTKQS